MHTQRDCHSHDRIVLELKAPGMTSGEFINDFFDADRYVRYVNDFNAHALKSRSPPSSLDSAALPWTSFAGAHVFVDSRENLTCFPP